MVPTENENNVCSNLDHSTDTVHDITEFILGSELDINDIVVKNNEAVGISDQISDIDVDFEKDLRKTVSKKSIKSLNHVIYFTDLEWTDHIYDEDTKTLKTESYMNAILEKFCKYFSCIINCKNSKIIEKSIHIHTYKCRQLKCERIYKFTHDLNEVGKNESFTITYKGENYSHTQLISPQLRRKKRMEIKEKLAKSYASDVQRCLMKEMDMDLKDKGNLNNYKGISVLNVARKEVPSSLDCENC